MFCLTFSLFSEHGEILFLFFILREGETEKRDYSMRVSMLFVISADIDSFICGKKLFAENFSHAKQTVKPALR